MKSNGVSRLTSKHDRRRQPVPDLLELLMTGSPIFPPCPKCGKSWILERNGNRSCRHCGFIIVQAPKATQSGVIPKHTYRGLLAAERLGKV